LKTLIIYNPKSGDVGRKPALLARVRREVAAHYPDCEIAPTERRGHAGELARQAVAEGCGTVLAFGGDGTMNEIAQALMDTPAVMGLVPAGSGNGLARHLGIPLQPEAALALLHGGRVRTIDAGLADGRPFFVVAGLGFEAEIARRFDGLASRGLAGYVTTGTLAWRKYQPQDFSIGQNGSGFVRKTFTLAVANCNQYGNNARIAPRALVDDGLLNLAAVPPIGLLNGLPLLVRLFCGSLDRRADVLQLTGKEFIVERAAPGPLHTDGETHEAGGRVEFSIRPGCLRVLVPA
jgi:diacylglycerol kinase (ATP)